MIDDHPLVTPRMRERLGVWTPWGPPSPPVAASDIRRWAIAVYWPNTPPRLFWDHDYARTTRWGGIIAPAEFNPFAWPVPTGDERHRADVAGPRPRRLNAGARMRFGVPVRPGDRIAARTRIEGWTAKRGRSGDLLFVDIHHEWRNQEGADVRDAIHTLAYF